MSDLIKLSSVAKDNLSANDVLQWGENLLPKDETLYGLVSSPLEYSAVQVEEKDKVIKQGHVFQSEHLFEIRLFCTQWEMRWVRNGAKGKAVLIWDSQSVFDHSPNTLEKTDVETVQVIPNHYLLWGQYMEEKDGWTMLAVARIGKIWVPWHEEELTENSRITLKCQEYTKRFSHGNVAVLAERLTGFGHIKGEVQSNG